MLRIKEILKEKGLTQKELAEKIGVSRISIVKTIAGNPTVDTLQKIASALNVPIVKLFDNKEESNTIKCPNCGEQINITVSESKA